MEHLQKFYIGGRWVDPVLYATMLVLESGDGSAGRWCRHGQRRRRG